MLRDQLPRVAAMGVCLLLLGSLFVLGGTGWPEDPGAGPGVDIEDPAVDPQTHASEFVETGGIVVSTNPVVIEIETDDGGTDRITLENAPDVEDGEFVTVSGTLTEDGTLVVERKRAVTREPWEIAYMYLVSVVGVLIVVATGIDSWRVNVRTLSVEPRDRPLHRTIFDRGGDRNG